MKQMVEFARRCAGMMMKIIAWMIRIVVLLALVWLAVLNKQTVTFSVMQGLQVDLPLIVLLFAFFVMGLVLGMLVLAPKYFSLKWEARRLRKETEQNRNVIADQQVLLSKYTPNQTPSGAANQVVNSELPPFSM